MARITPYSAMIFCTRTRMIQKTEEMKENIKGTVEEIKAIADTPDFPRAFGRFELPIKLIALPEAFSTGWPDSYLDLDNAGNRKVYDTTVPGEETDMPFKDLREFIARLEQEGEAQRIQEEVEWNLEAGAMIRKSNEVGLPAPFFQKVKDYPDGYRTESRCVGRGYRIHTATDRVHQATP